MTVDELKIQNYRNYEEEEFSFSPGINLIIGDNAQGKTSILEALFYCAAGRSHRGSKDKELIRFEQEEAHIRLKLTKKEIDHVIDVHLKQTGRKGIAVDRQPLRKTVDLFGTVNMVFFAPEDLYVIKSGPAERRAFLDTELCQLDRTYAHCLTQYSKALQQKSRLLKQIEEQPSLADTLDVWNEQLINYGVPVIERRRQHVAELSEIILEKNRQLSDGKETLLAAYEPSVEAENFAAKLKELRGRELASGLCLTGPHRDDVGFSINDADVRRFGSQGQQRTAALSLKLAEIDIISQKTGDTPVLLLDDVLSELDTGRQQRLLSGIEEIQTVITTTGLDEETQKKFKTDKVFTIKDGRRIGERRS